MISAYFIGHGSPTNVIEDNEFSRAWSVEGADLGGGIRAIVVISAHWESDGTRITAMERPRTIYDFRGFPAEMYQLVYPAPGSSSIAREIAEFLSPQIQVQLDFDWGLDHGAWTILAKMFPKAEIPVLQLSLDRKLGLSQHYELGKALAPLRSKGILFLGSGDLVHNLREVQWQERGSAWAEEFDQEIVRKIEQREHADLCDLSKLGPHARRAIPTLDHWLPLLYILGMQGEQEKAEFFIRKTTLGAISMSSFRLANQ